MSLDPQFYDIGEALHNALLTSPRTKADCATHMISKGGLALSQAVLERSIDLIAQDLYDQLVLLSSDYDSLLSRHQSAPPATALRELKISNFVVAIKYEIELEQAKLDESMAVYMSLSSQQKTAIKPIKVVADEGIIKIREGLDVLNSRLSAVNRMRNLGEFIS